jgi:hypothetical protein
MIPFSKSLYLTLALLVTGSAFSQTPDTLVVYEYIHVTDTVWVEPDIIEMPCPKKDSLIIESTKTNTQPDVLFDKKSATFSQSFIIKENNNKNEQMSKARWITMLLLSMNTTIYAQQKWSINGGTEAMWLQHQTSTISNPMWSGGYLGIERQINFTNSRFSISTGLTATYMAPPGEYKQVKEIDETLPYLEYDYAKIYTRILLDELNTGLFTLNYLQISVPVKINVHFGNWKPFVGLEYNRIEFLNSKNYIGSPSYPIPLETSFNIASCTGGINYHITSRIGINVEFSNSLNGIYNSLSIPTGLNLGVDKYFFNIIRFKLGASYIF